MKIVIIQRVLPPYRLGPLDLIAEALEQRGGELIVLHSDPGPVAGSAARGFRALRLPSLSIGGSVLQRGLVSAIPADCDLVVAEFGLKLVGLPHLLRFCRRRGIRFAWWGSGWEAWRETGRGIGDRTRRRWRRHLARSAHGILTYGDGARDFYAEVGVPFGRIHVAPNAVDTRVARRAAAEAEQRFPDREAARAALGLADRRIFVFLGRLLDYKGVDRLIEAISRVSTRHPEVMALIVGDGPRRSRLELMARRCAPDHVILRPGTTDPDEKALYFRAAEALVLPAQAGLAVNEALAHGLPVLCGSTAGPELESLQEGRNGLFVDAAGPRTLEMAIESLITDPSLASRLRAGAAETCGHDVEEMVRGFVEGAAAIVRRSDVLVLGPLPPPVHGVAVMFRTLLDELERDPRVELHHVPVGDPKKGRGFGVFSARNAWVAALDVLRGVVRLHRLRPRTAYLSLSQNRWAFLRDALLILAAKAFGARVVAHLHGAHFGRFRGSARPALRRFIDRVLGRVDRAVVLGECLRDILGPAVPVERVRVVPNGVAAPLATSASEPPGGSGPPHILFMGVLDETKGFRDLIRAMPVLRAECPGARLTIAGRWESEILRLDVEREIRALDLEEAVRFAGVVIGPAKAALFEEADLLCLPTYYPLEGLPVVVLEAMAAGRPVVATPRGAIAEVVRDGESGFLVPERNGPALVTALATLARDPGLRRAMGERARELHRRHYTAARFAELLAEVLLEPIETRKGAS
ncbi:MAG: hypothetical protein CME06_11460 [Gemmatimonadetes bacterium]|nr:hypothetical protein [Gemmatimonadota bacterium]